MNTLLPVLFVFLATACVNRDVTENPAPTLSYQIAMTQAGAAFEIEDWDSLNHNLDAAQLARPYSLYVLKNRILARSLAGRTDEAFALIEQAAERGLTLDLNGHEAFDLLKADPLYAPLKARMVENQKPIGTPAVFLRHDDTSLLPEAIADDGAGGVYVGSVRNGEIIHLLRDGTRSRMATAPGGVFDLELRGHTIWAAVNNQLAYVGGKEQPPFAAIMAFDQVTGAIIHETRMTGADVLFGDIEIDAMGAVYASDSSTPRIVKYSPGPDAIIEFAIDDRLVNLQGIALDEAGGHLFVADYLVGLFVINLADGVVRPIRNAANAHLGGIDGLYHHEGALIGIQNGSTPQRIIRMELNDKADAVVRLDVIQQNIDTWNEPTHGYLAHDAFRYIATSNWPSYDDAWNDRTDRPAKPLLVMTAPY